MLVILFIFIFGHRAFLDSDLLSIEDQVFLFVQLESHRYV